MQALILGSTSPYRRQLLQRLGLPFTTQNPDIDESAQPGESAQALSERLAISKAEAVAAMLLDADEGKDDSPKVIIGSDQVASCANALLGKPGDKTTAITQLSSMAGKSVKFYTAVHLRSPSQIFTHIDCTTAVMRNLSLDEIERYVASEPALDCAGSFKVEGLGISLFSEVKSTDPSALMGLPLIAVSNGLRKMGFKLP